MKTLYLSDLDGTLLRSDERLSRYTINTLEQFVKNGGCFSYATARSFTTASKATAGLNIEFPVICYNGTFIVGNKTQEILHSNFFTQEEIQAVRQTLEECGVLPIVYAFIDGKECFSFMERNLSAGARFFLESRLGDARRRKADSENELYSGSMFYFTCISNEAELEPVYDAFKSNSRVNCIYQKDLYSGAQWCELMPKKATKANAALQLKAMLSCDKLVVFGDGMNDLSMFSIADESYAMANAVPKLKEIATAVIDSNDSDGVAKFMLNAMP